MGMTKREAAAKIEITNILQKEGYVTYARLFELFDLHLTKDPNTVGYMIPDKAVITVNENLSIDQVSFVIRHEILHEYLDHQLRMKQHMGDDKYDKRSSAIHQLINMAADWEISNRGYTKKDKRTAKHLMLGDKEVAGLVTDIDHPDWVNLSMEEMFDKLNQEYEQDKEQMEQMLQQMADAGISIGDYDEAQQEMEEIERQSQIQAEQAEDEGDSKGQEKNDQISQAAGKAADDLEDAEQNSGGKVFKSDEQQKQDEELAKRVEAIKKAFKDEATKKNIEKDEFDKSEQAELIQAAKDAKTYKESPIEKFRLSLNQFIRNATATGRGPTWTRINKKYANSGLLKPGSSRLRQNDVPSINVYFDRSASWDDEKTKAGESAMAFLYDYERRGKIKVELYYFAVDVHGGKTGKKDAEREGGTRGEPILQHILKTQPDNVIIMTDDGCYDARTDVTVPGAVYLLFKGGRTQELIDHLHGRRITQVFDI